MCGTMNDANVQSCTFCGYLFENYGTGTVSGPKANQTADPSLNTVQPQPDQNVPPVSGSYSSISPGTSLYTVSRSLVGSLIPALLYLFFIGSVGLFSGFNIYSILLVVFFVLVAVIPALYTPRLFEFYDDHLRIHKTVGKDSEIPYSDLTMVDNPVRARGQQIVLSASGQRRPIVISKNPSNQQLGMDLKTFLNSKLKKNPPVGTPESRASNSSTENENNMDSSASGNTGSNYPSM